MADKSIGQLTRAPAQISDYTGQELFVIEQSNTAKSLPMQTLENWLVSFADGHGGIQSIAKTSTSGLTDTYTITLADNTTFTFTVTNGKAVRQIQPFFAVSNSKTTSPNSYSASMPNLTPENPYLWGFTKYTFNDGSSVGTTRNVIGVYGDKGDKGDTGNTGNGISSLAQTGRVAGEYTIYTFTMTNGTTQSFNSYDGAGITSINTYFAVSSSDTTPPTNWSESRQNMTATNRYLWSYQEIHLSDNTTIPTQKIVIGVYGDKGDPGEVTQAEFDELGGEVSDLKSAFITDTEAITGNKPLIFIKGRYATSAVPAVGRQVSYNESDELVCAICPCEPGDVFSGHICGYTGTSRAYFFCDAEMKLVSGGWATAYYELNGEKIAPANSAFAIFNNRLESLPDGYYAVKKSLLKNVVGEIQSAIAPIEDSYTASRAYTVGSFLFVGTKFYKVTAAISSGDTITPNTNVTQTTVAEQLMELAGN